MSSPAAPVVARLGSVEVVSLDPKVDKPISASLVWTLPPRTFVSGPGGLGPSSRFLRCPKHWEAKDCLLYQPQNGTHVPNDFLSGTGDKAEA